MVNKTRDPKQALCSYVLLWLPLSTMAMKDVQWFWENKTQLNAVSLSPSLPQMLRSFSFCKQVWSDLTPKGSGRACPALLWFLSIQMLGNQSFGGASWGCNMCNGPGLHPQKGLMLYGPHSETLTNFQKGALHFQCALGRANYVPGPEETLQEIQRHICFCSLRM